MALTAEKASEPGGQASAMRTGHRWKALVVAVVIVLVAELFTRFISSHLLPPQSPGVGEVALKYEQVKAMAASGGIDLELVGDSMLDAAADPALVAAASGRFARPYNASLRGARLPAQQVWVFGRLLPVTRPKLVVQGVSPTLVSSLGASPTDVTAFDTMLTDNLKALDPDAWARADQALADSLYLVRYRASLRSPRLVATATWDKLAGNPSLQPDDLGPAYWRKITSPSGQSIEYSSGTAKLEGLDPLFAAVSSLLDGGYQFGPLDTMLDGYRAIGLPVVVVVPPVAGDLLQRGGVDAGRWRQAAARIADHVRSRGEVVVDFSDRPYPTEWFYDPFHLNGTGSRQFSTDLGAALRDACTTDTALRCG